MNGSESGLVVVAEVLAVEDGPDGRIGIVTVRGALRRVVLDLLPEVRPGDAVLLHAGVALAQWRDGRPWDEEDRSCA